MARKNLYRIREGRKIAGVCGGIADYLDVDPVVVRLIWLIAILCCGIGALAYLIAWIVVPEEPQVIVK